MFITASIYWIYE